MSAPCTGVAASWCPNCGTCICRSEDDPEAPLDSPNCPLHSVDSRHAEGPTVDLVAAERAVILEIVNGAGCLCFLLQELGSFNGQVAGSRARPRVIVHDRRCPRALAAQIEARAGEGEP